MISALIILGIVCLIINLLLIALYKTGYFEILLLRGERVSGWLAAVLIVWGLNVGWVLGFGLWVLG